MFVLIYHSMAARRGLKALSIGTDAVSGEYLKKEE